MSTITTVATLVVVAAAAVYQLSDRLDAVVATFFEYNLAEQVGVMALLFTTVFTAVTVSHVIAQTPPPVLLTSPRERASYPLAEIESAPNTKAQFEALYPMLRNELLLHCKRNEMPAESIDWLGNMLDYNVPGGKLNRGTTVVAVYQALLPKNRTLMTLEIAQASVLGWVIEFLQAFFLVADDVMDDSQTRRGQPCWYKKDTVQLIAINDSFLLESFCFTILKQHFGHLPCYHDLIDLLLDVTQKTEFGQLLDLTSQPHDSKKIELSRFTKSRYQLIVKYKTAFYSFYLPVAMGMILSGRSLRHDADAFDRARTMCVQMGEYFQIQDDYLDCFGDPATIGKVGTDIQDNKCSWLVVQALERCSAPQRKLLEQNYGQWNDRRVMSVKQLYRDLDLPRVFEAYEEASYASFQKQLDEVTASVNLPREVFDVLLQKIYKRSK